MKIKHYITGTVLFEFEKENNTQRDTILEAIKQHANLRFANLRFAKNIPDRWLDYWWHVHHEMLVEQLFEPIHNRINYIKTDKPKEEIELRLQLLKPVLGKIPTTEKGWERLHKKECKSCPWDSKQNTIFPK